LTNLWRNLLESAVRAPSPHNVQPWRVRLLDASSADLLIEKRRTLPAEDTTGSFIILTMGLFIEALSVLAANRAHRLSYELFEEPERYTAERITATDAELLPFARLSLHEDASVRPSYDDALFLRRRTSRISLKPDPVPAEASRALAELASSWGQHYAQFTDALLIERVLARNTEALFADLNAPGYHDEIVEWFRFTTRQARLTRDGLDYRCMNSSRAAFWAAARFPGLLQNPLTRPLLSRVYRRQVGLVPTLALLAGPFWRPADAFQTGRFLLRFWLELSRHDLYIHPYGNLVTNHAAARWCRTELGVEDIWLVFKIGHSAEPPESFRRAVEEILVD
jgi:hypothetical protein